MKPFKTSHAGNNSGKSKRRLVLYLSGKWKQSYADAFDQDDYLYCAPGFAAQAPGLNWKEFPWHPEDPAALSEKCAELLLSNDKELNKDVKNALVNAYFYYGVSPVAAQLQEIDRLISDTKPMSLVVISSRSGMRHIPAIGIVTSESNRGSPNLLGSLVANAIIEAKLDLPVERITSRGDLLSNPAIRYVVLRLSTTALIFIAAMRIITSPIGTWKSLGDGCKVLVCVRSPGHAGHAARIFDGLGHVAALVIPQFTGSNKMREIAQIVGGHTPLFRPAATDVLYALVRSIFTLKPVKMNRLQSKQHLSIGRFSIPASPDDLSREMRLFRHLVFHKTLLERSVRRFNGHIRKLVGFEIKGPFASIEAMAGWSCSVQTVVVQTVLTQPRPLPIFPLSNLFYADGLDTAEAIKHIAQYRLGQVEFVGSPHAVVPMTSDAIVRSVVFMSQPYETPQTLSLLRSLSDVARDFGFRIRIRLHPRDDRKNYEPVLVGAEDVIEICESKSLADSISCADLCVTRVSSSAKEALAAGKPVMICLWSELDRTVVADYIAQDALAQHYVATDATQLRKIMGDFKKLIGANAELQNRLFCDKGLNALRAAIMD